MMLKMLGNEVRTAHDGLEAIERAEDFRPRNRFAVAKDLIGDFISKRQDDRIGIVTFGVRAATRVPITYDREVAGAILPIRPIQPERQPDLGAVIHHISPGLHDADHFPTHPIDLDCRSNDRPASKCALPQLVRKNRNGRRRRRRSRCWRRADDIGFSFAE